MDWLRELRFKFFAIFRRRRIEDEMAEEIRTHLELDIAAAQKEGLDPLEARYGAQRNFGGFEQITEHCQRCPWRPLARHRGVVNNQEHVSPAIILPRRSHSLNQLSLP